MNSQHALLPGTIPSPNIWDHPDLYELENAAVDPGGVIDSAIAELVGYDASGPRPGWGNVLDVGCGAGFHLPRLAAHARIVTGVEPHPGLVARARRRTAALGNVTVRRGIAQSLPVPDCSVDVFHARWAYFFGPGCEPGLAELRRVCRSGAVAVIVDHDATRSSVGRWFAAGLRADGIRHDPRELERFWTRQGFSCRSLDVRWVFRRQEDLEAVLRIEFPAAVAAGALGEVAAGGGGWTVDAAVNVWFRRF